MRQNHSWDLVALVIKLPFWFFEKCNVSYLRVFLLFVYTHLILLFLTLWQQEPISWDTIVLMKKS